MYDRKKTGNIGTKMLTIVCEWWDFVDFLIFFVLYWTPLIFFFFIQ